MVVGVGGVGWGGGGGGLYDVIIYLPGVCVLCPCRIWVSQRNSIETISCFLKVNRIDF